MTITKTPSRLDFNNLQNDFYKKIENLNISKFGIVKTGFLLFLKENKLVLTSGLGYSPLGKEFLLNKSKEIEIDLAKSYYIYLNLTEVLRDRLDLRDLNQKLIYKGFKRSFNEPLLEVLENNNEFGDPYSHDIFKNKNILVIGFIEDSEIFELNRSYQIPNFPIDQIILYSNSNFRDYVTLRGCKLDKSYLNKFIKFSSVSGEIGGCSNKTLEAKHIPSLGEIKGKTEYSGDHSHYYETKSWMNDGWGNGGQKWCGVKRDTTSIDGIHDHKISSGNFTNNNVQNLETEPDYVSYLPIIREY